MHFHCGTVKLQITQTPKLQLHKKPKIEYNSMQKTVIISDIQYKHNYNYVQDLLPYLTVNIGSGYGHKNGIGIAQLSIFKLILLLILLHIVCNSFLVLVLVSYFSSN